MWKQSVNDTRQELCYCRVLNFKQYLKAITSLYNDGDLWSEGLWYCDYAEWHQYFMTRYMDECDELYEVEELPDPNTFKCGEDEIGLTPEKYPAILVWNLDADELSIF